MPDQVDVKGAVLLPRSDRFEGPLRLLQARAVRDESEPPGEAVDVGVHREERHIEGEEEDDGRGLRPHPRKGHEVVAGHLRPFIAEEVQVYRSRPFLRVISSL